MQTTARELLAAAPQLSVGMLTADPLCRGDELVALDDAGVRLVHVDVMDGVFCPMITVGAPVVRALPDRFVKDVHLMIDEPLEKIHGFVEAGAGILTLHLEATRHPHRVLQSLAGRGVVRGVALNPVPELHSTADNRGARARHWEGDRPRDRWRHRCGERTRDARQDLPTTPRIDGVRADSHAPMDCFRTTLCRAASKSR